MISSPNAVYAVYSAAAALGLTLPLPLPAQSSRSSHQQKRALTKVTRPHCQGSGQGSLDTCVKQIYAPLTHSQTPQMGALGQRKLKKSQWIVCHTSLAQLGSGLPNATNTCWITLYSFILCLNIVPSLPPLWSPLHFYNWYRSKTNTIPQTDSPFGIGNKSHWLSKHQGQSQSLHARWTCSFCRMTDINYAFNPRMYIGTSGSPLLLPSSSSSSWQILIQPLPCARLCPKNLRVLTSDLITALEGNHYHHPNFTN